MSPEELTAAGFDISRTAYRRLARFVSLLLTESERVNLTAIRDLPEIWRLHVCDSLALLPLMRRYGPRRVMDVGSGGGLPGIPLACVCEQTDVTLLEARRKKIDALRRIIAALGLLNAHALWGRAETVAHEPTYREQFDAVTSRAVAGLPILIEYVAGFVRPGGQCWLFKSAAKADAERQQACRAADACQLVWVETIGYRLPGESSERAILVYRKEGTLDAHLPRRPGRASKRPL